MEFTKEIDGKKMFVQTGGMALQANGSCLVGLGETIVLATATMANKEAESKKRGCAKFLFSLNL